MLDIYLQESVYAPIIESMITSDPWGAPQGPFYLLNGNVTPKVPRATSFIIETDQVGSVVRVDIAKVNPAAIGVDPRSNPQTYFFQTIGTTTAVAIQLNPGLNQIQAQILGNPAEIVYYQVSASTIVALWEGWARVLYNEAVAIINDQEQAIFSNVGTRLLEPFINFQDLLPDIQSLQILSTRLIARGMIHNVGTNSGVQDLLTAFTLGTPVLRTMERDNFDQDVLDPYTNTASQVYGQEAHIWMPNLGVASWAAFLRYLAAQEDLYTPVKVSEDEVAVTYQNNLQIHTFNFATFGLDFITALALSQCFKSISINILLNSQVAFKICAAAYTFDLFITPSDPIGLSRISFDINVPFDQNLPFDNDDVDPFNEGWIGLSLDGRFEQEELTQHCLDTFVIPSVAFGGPECCYNGYYTQVVEHQKYDFFVNSQFLASGTMN
jgi:hypothetical protein